MFTSSTRQARVSPCLVLELLFRSYMFIYVFFPLLGACLAATSSACFFVDGKSVSSQNAATKIEMGVRLCMPRGGDHNVY